MDIRETIVSAFKQLISNKVRTFLTMLGIFIGIASVVMIFALGNSFQKYIENQWSDLGINTFSISAKKVSNDFLITEEDIECIKQIEGVETIACAESVEATLFDIVGKQYSISVIGAEKDYTSLIQTLEIIAGRNFVEQDDNIGTQVIIIGDVVGKAMFGNMPYEQMVGRSIKVLINNQFLDYEIIGIYETELIDKFSLKKIKNYYGEQTFFIPYKTLTTIDTRTKGIISISGVVQNGYDQVTVAGMATQVINKRHNLIDGYSSQTLVQVIEMVKNIMSIITLFFSVIGSISLIVGGVGIMNIMIVTVKERITEIGIRKALGASNESILQQFLMEALILTLVAGVIGLIIGYIGASIVAKKLDLQVEVSIGAIIVSLLGSVGIGVVFGVYPAYQAAQMEPIDALRME